MLACTRGVDENTLRAKGIAPDLKERLSTALRQGPIVHAYRRKMVASAAIAGAVADDGNDVDGELRALLQCLRLDPDAQNHYRSGCHG